MGDGDWEKVQLSTEFRISKSEKLAETTAVVLIHEGRDGPELMLGVGDSRWTQKLAEMPDFSKMWVSQEGKRILHGCIILARESKKPNELTDREEDWVRVIGLELKTK